ncbi:DUF2953 domain-containing protein [Sporomusa termitida]|uniref:DUF2953 domain-containing protein n=1 Tax=Sporomusa termitida TaxID=2377 RepID=A0A517DTT4_9FIRM|nr:DUF2953 domain-containing protein [Sporomusa termitida]QDR80762.1 hypothetical protein SPTER_20960 [Sporomusa termitida]
MVNWLMIIAAGIILLFMLSRINVYIELYLCRHNDDDHLAITLHALKPLFVYTIKIPVIEIVQYNELPWITSKIKAPAGGTETYVAREQRFVKRMAEFFLTNPRKFHKLMRGVNRYIRTYRYYINNLVSSIHCQKIDIKIVYGFDDAAFTGLMMGVFGAAQGFLLTALNTRLKLDAKPAIKIIPVYGQCRLQLDFQCILRIRLGKVITATMATLTNSLYKEATRSG